MNGGTASVLQLVADYGVLALLAVVVLRGIKSFDGLAHAIRDMRRVMSRLAVLIVQHDATVRGKNPETVGTTEELLRRIDGV